MKKWLLCLLALVLAIPSACAEDALPAFVYQDEDAYEAAVCDYLVDEASAMYAPAAVSIPAPGILLVDDSDPQNVLVWGSFGVYQYSLCNTTLICESGGVESGMLRLRPAADGGYTVASADLAGDGEGFARDIERIFGQREGLTERYYERYDEQEAARLRLIGDYVKWNGLDITQYQDFGWSPVRLPGARPTTDEEQMVRMESPMGYAIEYDLRRFSYAAYGEDEEGLSGVDALEGISIGFERRADEGAEAAAARLSDELDEPRCESVAFGALGARALRVRDGALREDVVADRYVLPLGEGCLIVSVSNTYYAVEGDPVVAGADEALRGVLDTFRLA